MRKKRKGKGVKYLNAANKETIKNNLSMGKKRHRGSETIEEIPYTFLQFSVQNFRAWPESSQVSAVSKNLSDTKLL